MPTSTTYFRQIISFLYLDWVIAEDYMKLQYFIIILSLIPLQGSGCIHAPGEVDGFNTHCSAVIAAATCQMWWKLVNPL